MSSRLTPLLPRLRGLTASHTPDIELLERFVRGQDQEAFAMLVRRHGAMVLGVCRRIVGDAHTAEDCSQAVWLVLARRAGSLGQPAELAGWLHGVAYRVALKARRAAQRPSSRTRPAAREPADPVSDPLSEMTGRELLGLLEEEVQRLPAAYRLPVALCCLEGLSQEEAALRLGCTPGALRGRLQRGRARLHGRLLKRGISLAAALAAAEADQVAATATLPAALLTGTVEAALGFISSSGKAARTVPAAARLARAAGSAPGLARWSLVLMIVGIGIAALIADAVSPRAEDPPGKDRQFTQVAPMRAGDAVGPALARDEHGDELPAGSLRRYGTVRFRHAEGITCFAYTGDGNSLFTGSHDATVRQWNASDGKELRRFVGHHGAVRHIALSPDGKTLASTGSGGWAGDPPGQIRIWSVATGAELGRLDGPRSPVEALGWSPDSARLATASSDGTVELFDVAMLAPLWSRKLHAKSAHSVVFAPDGKLLASCGSDGVICIVDVSGMGEPRRLSGEEKEFHLVAFLNQGRVLLSCGDCYGPEVASTIPSVNRVSLWDVATGNRLRGFHVGARADPSTRAGTTAWALAPDHKLLAFGHDEYTVKLWDLGAGRPVGKLGGFPERFSRVRALAWAPDSKRLAECGFNHAVCILDATTGTQIKPAGASQESNIRALAVSRDGKLVATASEDHTLVLWHAATGRALHTLRGHDSSVYAVAISPDGRLAASGGPDGAVCLWDTATGARRHRIDVAGGPRTLGLARNFIGRLAFSPDGRLLAAGGGANFGNGGLAVGANLVLIDVARGTLVREIDAGAFPHHGDLAFATDGRLVGASDDGTIRRWDTGTGKEVARSLFHQGELAPSLRLSPDGATAAAASYDGLTRVWDIATNKDWLAVKRDEGTNRHAVFTSDSRYVALCGARGRPDKMSDHFMELWEVHSGQCVLKRRLPPQTGVSSGAFSADGRTLFTGMADTTALAWDLRPPMLARAAAKPEALWEILAQRDAAQAWQAIATLEAMPAVAVTLIRSRLRPDAAAADRAHRLIADLDSDEFEVRADAADALAQLGAAAEPAMRKALRGQPHLETRRRIEGLLEKSDLLMPPNRLRLLRCIEVLERIGTREACEALQSLTEGAFGQRPAHAAQAALARLRLQTGSQQPDAR
jgi:RNA polymerase sigma factor (sigma-70 family)